MKTIQKENLILTSLIGSISIITVGQYYLLYSVVSTYYNSVGTAVLMQLIIIG
jgi:hypothetical protein